MKNTYIPYPVRISKTLMETEDKQLKSFWLDFLNLDDTRAFDYMPGQFGELSVSGYGEIPIGIASSPTEGEVQVTVIYYELADMAAQGYHRSASI